MKTIKLLAWLLIFCVCLSVCGVAEDAEAGGELRVHFVNVGRNDGILIECGGESAFIDSGVHIVGEKCAQYLQDNGITTLKYYIGTHAHNDHVGGAGAILSKVPAEAILTNHEQAITSMVNNCRTQDGKDAVQRTPWTVVEMGDVFMIGDARLACVGPDVIRPYTNYAIGEENNNSLIFRLTYGNISFLLTADATNDVLKRMLKLDPDFLNCTVFKSPHHNLGLHDDVAMQLKCEYYIFTTSKDNPPGVHHINNARLVGAKVLITSDNHAGTVVFTTDGETIDYTCENALSEKWGLGITSVKLKVGNSKSFEHKMRPSRMVDTLNFESSDTSVAVCDPCTGKITAVGVGTCVIRAIAFDKTVREIEVTVKAK